MSALKKHALFFVYVWPEPMSSAAGVRTYALLRALKNAGYELSAVSPSQTSAHSEALNRFGCATYPCDPNASIPTEESLRALSPSLVVYDRFVMEEQFGWRARALWPEALHLVDTQDLHSLRRARERMVAAGKSGEAVKYPSHADMGEDLLRELASLYRADAALVVSAFEHSLLLGLGYPAESLLHLAFPAPRDPAPAPFEARRGFCFLGNFRHPPNLHGVRWLLVELWPAVRKALPAAELHLYGAYPPAEISRHKGEKGIFAHGPVADHRAALRSHRALLSPLRFGAGIKGKVLEAWGTGTPVIGTALSFEGMGKEGLLAEDGDQLAEACLALEDGALWRKESLSGLEAVGALYGEASLREAFVSFVEGKTKGLPALRARNLTGAMLRHHSLNASKYFSRWIEAKNRA